MNSISAFFESRYQRVVASIAFWPTVLGISFFSLAIWLRHIGTSEFSLLIEDVAPYLLIRDRDVSLSLLTTLIGGLISMMVFSFSMVMVLLSNATANLSPRLLPSLIGSTRHQMVLGTYLGTILYCIIIAMGFGLSVDGKAPPSFTVALAVMFGIVCLALFIAFIHGVSRSIQVGVALKDSHLVTIEAIEGILSRNAEQSPVLTPDVEHWTPVYARESGHFQGVDDATIVSFAKKHDLHLAVSTLRGKYILEGDEVLRVDSGRLEDKQLEELLDDLRFSATELTTEYYAYGIERIVEVALKALSPGINDPGTALVAIDYLKDIFVKALPVGEWEIISDNQDQVRVYVLLESWHSLLTMQFTSIYSYGKSDHRVVQRLRDTLNAFRIRLDAGHHERRIAVERLLSKLTLPKDS